MTRWRWAYEDGSLAWLPVYAGDDGTTAHAFD
jgi:hypothetical protein